MWLPKFLFLVACTAYRVYQLPYTADIVHEDGPVADKIKMVDEKLLGEFEKLKKNQQAYFNQNTKWISWYDECYIAKVKHKIYPYLH